MNPLLIVEVIGLLLLLAGHAAVLVGWYLRRENAHDVEDTRRHEAVLKREKTHEVEDTQRCESIRLEMNAIRKDHAGLNGRVEGLVAKVDAMPDRDTLDEHIKRLEDRMGNRFTEISNQLSQLMKMLYDGTTRNPNQRSTD